MITMPKVELLASELAKGLTPVGLYDSYVDAAKSIEPRPSDEQLKQMLEELKARIQFAWELAREASIRNRTKGAI